MPDYNPNARWGSRKKKVDYTPPERTYMPETPSGDRGIPPVVSQPVGSGKGKRVAIMIGVALIVLAAAYGTWLFINRPVPAPIVGLAFAAPSEVPVGDPFGFSVLYNNSSTVALRNASLVITLPNGVFFVGQPQSVQTVTMPIGDVAAGDSSSTSVQLLVAAGSPDVAQISSALSYSTDASSGKSFTASYKGSITVNPSVIGLTISAPTNVFAGQGFVTKVSYANTTDHPIDGVEITMQYPGGFTFTGGSPAPAFPENNVWKIDSLAPGASGNISITGTMNGKNTALYSLSGTAAETVSGGSYTVAAAAANIAITASPLTIGAVVNNDPNYIAKLNDYLDYKITYANLSSTTFQDVAITATLEGDMFDLSSVQSDAAFNSRADTLTWYAANTPELASVAPGATGSVDLRVRTGSSFPIVTAADKDFALGIHLTVSSVTVPAGTVATSTSASADITNKVGGAAAIDAVGYRYETGTTIQNSGPYPPKVNQATTYTIHWRVTNYSTDIQGVDVSAYLQNGTMCTGQIASTISAVPVCNSATGEVTWAIPGMYAGTGVLNAPIEAVFQVENMPAVNQVAQTVTLLGKTSLTATDEFTNAAVSASANPIGTDIPADKAVTANDRSVKE